MYNDWRNCRINDEKGCEPFILNSDLGKVKQLNVNDFSEVLFQFIPQITKIKDGSDYPGKTLYEMVVSIQKYLNQNDVAWKLIDGVEFVNVKNVLDNTMKERAAKILA